MNKYSLLPVLSARVVPAAQTRGWEVGAAGGGGSGGGSVPPRELGGGGGHREGGGGGGGRTRLPLRLLAPAAPPLSASSLQLGCGARPAAAPFPSIQKGCKTGVEAF